MEENHSEGKNTQWVVMPVKEEDLADILVGVIFSVAVNMIITITTFIFQNQGHCTSQERAHYMHWKGAWVGPTPRPPQW
jgi:hypothetical protein